MAKTICDSYAHALVHEMIGGLLVVILVFVLFQTKIRNDIFSH